MIKISGWSRRVLEAVRNQVAGWSLPRRPTWPVLTISTRSAFIATAAVACIAAVLLGARLTTTLIGTSSGGKPQQVVEKPNAVVPKIVVASMNLLPGGEAAQKQ